MENRDQASVYIHIPFCNSKCSYCDFFSITDHSTMEKVTDCTIRQLRDCLEHFGIRRIPTVYIGGGTPTSLPYHVLEKLLDFVAALEREPGAEVTIEANPETITPELLRILESSPVNRLSLGIQSFDNRTLKTLGRHCTGEAAVKGVELVKKHWNGRLNLDFMASVPGQEPESVLADLRKGLSFFPDHISFYALTVEEGTPIAARYDASDTAAWEEGWNRGAFFLEESGFRRYEISNFARPGFESRHNIGYWHLRQYLGAGPGGVSTLYKAEGKGLLRLSGTHDIHRFIESDDIFRGSEREEISESEHLFEYLMMGFRMTEGISEADFDSVFGKRLQDVMPKTCRDWMSRGLLKNENNRYFLTNEGLMILNPFLVNILEELSDS